MTNIMPAPAPLEHLPADHYATAPELHLMGSRASEAAGYLGVKAFAESGYLEPGYLEVPAATVASELSTTEAAMQSPLGQYVKQVESIAPAQLAEAPLHPVVKPEIKGTVKPEFSHDAVVAAMMARGKRFDLQRTHA